MQFDVACSAIFKAVGQKMAYPETEQLIPTISNGKIATFHNQLTSVDGVFAGGDCTGVGQDLTVEAVQQGKLAAIAINEQLNASIATPTTSTIAPINAALNKALSA